MGERRIRIAVVGCGLISQVMHLPYLQELDEHYEIAALCDLSEDVAAACARRFGAGWTTTRSENLFDLDPPLDAVLVATPGSHAPIAIAAAQRGLHVLVEKPMCVHVEEGIEMVRAAREANVRLMVGTMKRYDPAYERLAEELTEIEDLRLVRVTTLESPLDPYVAHYPRVKAAELPPALREQLAAEDDALVDAALGPDAGPSVRAGYRGVLLDCLVHELNALRGLLGEPDELRYADVGPRQATIVLRFGEVDCHLAWVDLPGIARYVQEFAFFAPDRRATLSLPSPFLRSAPSKLILEGGVVGTARAWQTVETTAFEEAFKRELLEFHACVTTGRDPRTDGLDGLHDVALCAAIARAAKDRGGCLAPSATPLDAEPTERVAR
jgi:predicted dehydrogenase